MNHENLHCWTVSNCYLQTARWGLLLVLSLLLAEPRATWAQEPKDPIGHCPLAGHVRDVSGNGQDAVNHGRLREPRLFRRALNPAEVRMLAGLR